MGAILTMMESLTPALLRLIASKERQERRLACFDKIYAPLYGLFLKRHITTAIGYRTPYLQQRLRNAGHYFAKRKVLLGLKAIFDKQPIGPFAEVEFGGSFPLPQIINLVKGNERYCDRMLLDLITQADRARYEEYPGQDNVTSAELSLYEHIMKQHHALNKKFIGI